MKKESAVCCHCHSKNTKLSLIVSPPYSVYTCHSCGLLFTYPQPTATLAVNDTKYNAKEEKKSRLAIYDRLYANAVKHIRQIQKYHKTGKFLDVGCSYGITVRAAKDMGFEACGVEPTKTAAEYAKKKLQVQVFHGMLDEAKYKDNTFDVITLFDVLEHIPDIDVFLKEVHRILKSGGLLVVQSPNADSFAFQVLGVNWNWLLVPYHLWHFSYASLSRILSNNGFSVKEGVSEDSVYDFASNFRSTLHFPIFSTGILFKVLRKIVYVLTYAGIFLGSPVWSRQKKGGLLRVYAIKG